MKKKPKKKYRLWNREENFHTAIGLEQSMASSAEPKQKFFARIYLSNPFPIKIGKKFNRPHSKLGSPLTIWGDIRFTSLPQQINSGLAEAPEKFKEKLRDLEVNKIVRGVDFLVGLDWRIAQLPLNGQKRYSLSLIGAWGASSPKSPIDSVQIYELNEDARELLSKEYEAYKTDIENEGKKYVAFVYPDRKRFFQQFFFGFRIKSYTKPELDENNNFNFIFPATFEVSFGVNDFIESKSFNGSRRKPVLRIGGYLPFSFNVGGGDINIYLFGTALVQFRKVDKHDITTHPIIMKPSPDTSFPGNNEVVQLPMKIERRDFFRIGIGVDLTTIVKKVFTSVPKPKSASK
jgi:hypothetical protein